MENSLGTKWICATRSSTKCRARVRTTKDSKLEVLRLDHNHERLKQRLKKHKNSSNMDDVKCSIKVKQNIE